MKNSITMPAHMSIYHASNCLRLGVHVNENMAVCDERHFSLYIWLYIYTQYLLLGTKQNIYSHRTTVHFSDILVVLELLRLYVHPSPSAPNATYTYFLHQLLFSLGIPKKRNKILIVKNREELYIFTAYMGVPQKSVRNYGVGSRRMNVKLRPSWIWL